MHRVGLWRMKSNCIDANTPTSIEPEMLQTPSSPGLKPAGEDGASATAISSTVFCDHELPPERHAGLERARSRGGRCPGGARLRPPGTRARLLRHVRAVAQFR